MTDTELLEKAIADSGLKKGAIAERLSLTRAGFRKKELGKTEFTATEIQILAKILGLSVKQREKIFFAGKVDLKSPAV